MLKKIAIIFVISLMVSHISYAQVRQIIEAAKPKKEFTGTPILAKKSSVLSLSIGAPNKLADFLDFGGVTAIIGTRSNKKSFGPLMIDYEYLIKNNIGIGVSLLAAKASSDYTVFANKYSGSITQYQLGFSSYYHLYTTDKLDPYVKATLGINLWDGGYKDQSNNETGNFVAPTPFGLRSLVGLRYFASSNVALLGELSVNISPNFNVAGNIGVAYKLK